MTNPFRRTGRGNSDPKLTLLRRADTERDSKGFSLTGERKQSKLAGRSPITLARVPSLEKPEEDDALHIHQPKNQE